jgi:hypothetical protein
MHPELRDKVERKRGEESGLYRRYEYLKYVPQRTIVPVLRRGITGGSSLCRVKKTPPIPSEPAARN